MDLEYWKELGIELGINILLAAITLVVGFWIANFLTKYIKRGFDKSKIDESLSKFLGKFIAGALKVLVIITALMMLGLEMTSFIALLGAAGLAIGLAFSGTLSNFAGGIILLVIKPFKVGDVVEAQGEMGVVREISIFLTEIKTFDNKIITIPNGSLANGNITNYTKEDIRRADLTVGIAYGDDYDKAKETLMRFVEEDERILKDPEPYIALANLNDSSVDLTFRVWTKVSDLWPVTHSLNEKIYKGFGKEGLNIPFPQMDVHMHNS